MMRSLLSDRLQRLLEEFRAARTVPGVSAAAVDGHGGIWSGSAGVADPDDCRPMTPTTQFAIGSVTKSFIAALVLRLMEREQIALADPIARFLPPDIETNGATVAEVLAHRSGIPEHVTPRFVAALLAEPSRAWQPLEVLRYRESAPGRRGDSAYSSTNFILLGLAVEQITRTSVATAVRRLLLAPQRLDRIAYQGSEAPVGPPAIGTTHLAGAAPQAIRDSSGLLPCRSVATAAGAAGGMAGDVESIARWGHLLYGGDLLRAESRRAMIGTGPRGLGSSRFELDGEEVLGHPGRIPGYRGLFAYLPSQDTSWAVLVNTDAEEADPSELLGRLVGCLRSAA